MGCCSVRPKMEAENTENRDQRLILYQNSTGVYSSPQSSNKIILKTFEGN